MSDLRTSFLKGKLSKLPAVPPFPREVDEEEAESESGDTFGDLHPSSSSVSVPPSQDSEAPLLSARRSKRSRQEYSPLTAEGCFDQALEVDVTVNKGPATFRVYYTPPKPKQKTKSQSSSASRSRPERSAKPGTLDDVSIDVTAATPPTLHLNRIGADDAGEEEDGDELGGSGASEPGILFLFHHGAGFSALSYALTAAEITQATQGEVGVLAFDCRGHGRTRVPDSLAGDSMDVSLDTLTSDLIALLRSMFPKQEEMPSLVLVGHSMGGSVVVSATHRLMAEGFDRISGVAVLDVVEGTAIDALGVMRSVVLGHPTGFPSIEAAIQWHVESKTIANAHSARISVPPLVVKNPAYTPDPSATSSSPSMDAEPQELLRDQASRAGHPQTQKDASHHAYHWKADLLATEPYWRGWFQGLSSRFLSVKTARLLLLAGTDRLDRELMIGQMQGKYQLEVISDVGHSLQEDAPDRTARILVDFWRRNERIRIPFKHIKKVGEQ